MSRTKSIAGVRPLGWLARVRAQSSCLAWACAAQSLGGAQRGWRQSRRWAWERAMTMRISARGQAKGGADGKAKSWRQAEGTAATVKESDECVLPVLANVDSCMSPYTILDMFYM